MNLARWCLTTKISFRFLPSLMRHVIYLGPSATSPKAEALNAQPATGKTETLWPHGRRKRCLCSEEKSKHQHTEFKECKCWQLFVGIGTTKNRQKLIVIICAVGGGGGGGYFLKRSRVRIYFVCRAKTSRRRAEGVNWPRRP